MSNSSDNSSNNNFSSNNSSQNNSNNNSKELEIETITILKGKRLLHCSSDNHVYDKYSPGPLMWLQGKDHKLYFGSKLNKPSNTNNINMKQENSWFCTEPLDKNPYNVFYFYKTRRPLRLLDNTDFTLITYLESNHRELFDKLPLIDYSTDTLPSKSYKNDQTYPHDYVIPMILSQLYGDKYDGIYHWDGEIILWGPFEEKLEFLRKEFNETLNPLKPWILPNRGPGTRYYMPSEEIKNELRAILDPYIRNIGGRRNNFRKKSRKNRKTRKNSKSRKSYRKT